MGDIMEILKYLIFAIFLITLISILVIAFKSKKPFKLLFLNLFFGISVLFLLYFTKRYTGIFIPINEYTVCLTGFLGIPAIIAFLIFNIIFI